MAWTTTKLAATGALAALRIVLSLPGMTLAAITGNSIMQGFINFPIIGITWAIVPLIIRRFGALTLWATIVSIIAIPLPLWGPPGAVIKVLYGLFYGISGDLIFFALRKNERLAAFFVAGFNGFFPVTDWLLWSLLNLPGEAAAAKVFLSPVLIFVFVLIDGLFGLVGWFIYSKLRRTAVILRIQSEAR